jgi:hypothetical protein
VTPDLEADQMNNSVKYIVLPEMVEDKKELELMHHNLHHFHHQLHLPLKENIENKLIDLHQDLCLNGQKQVVRLYKLRLVGRN